MMSSTSTKYLDPKTAEFYRWGMRTLDQAGVPFMVGGAYAFSRYTGIERHTKDFDIFVLKEDCQRALDVLTDAGCRTEMTFPHWLGKAYAGDEFIDVIFGAGNGVARVDPLWFDHAVGGEVLGLPAQLIPAEEMIWSKGLIQERERFDGADVAHLIRARGDQLDWSRLVLRFGDHWRVLLAHLIMFGFIFPRDRDRVPAPVMDLLLKKLSHRSEDDRQDPARCYGTIVSREQYLTDVEKDYVDARLAPTGSMSAADVAHWTEAIESK